MTKHYFNPKDGKINFERPSEFRKDLKSLPDARHYIEIKKYSQKRSNGANGYYWAVVIPHFCEEWGIDHKVKTWSEYMHYDVLGKELRQIPDETRPGQTRTQPTHTMTGSEFWKYIYQCGDLYYHYYNGQLPPPKSLGYDESKK